MLAAHVVAVDREGHDRKRIVDVDVVDLLGQRAGLGEELLRPRARQRLDDACGGEIEELAGEPVARMTLVWRLEQALGDEFLHEDRALRRVEREIVPQVRGADPRALGREAHDTR